MKKLLLTFSLIAVFAHFVSAQALQFAYNGKTLADNEIVTITAYTEDAFKAGSYYQKFQPVIKNNSSEKIEFKILKNEVEMPEGSYSTFCTDMGCFSGKESPVTSTIVAKSEYKSFYGQFFPVAPSSAIVKYTVKQKGGAEASATVEVHYKYTPSGVKSVGFTQFAVLQAGGTCRILYANDSDIQMKIYSITGKILGSYTLPASGTDFDLPITDYKGIAILSFTDKNGKTAAEKVVLK